MQHGERLKKEDFSLYFKHVGAILMGQLFKRYDKQPEGRAINCLKILFGSRLASSYREFSLKKVSI